MKAGDPEPREKIVEKLRRMICEWATFRAQTLRRTVRGISRNEQVCAFVDVYRTCCVSDSQDASLATILGPPALSRPFGTWQQPRCKTMRKSSSWCASSSTTWLRSRSERTAECLKSGVGWFTAAQLQPQEFGKIQEHEKKQEEGGPSSAFHDTFVSVKVPLHLLGDSNATGLASGPPKPLVAHAPFSGW